MSCQGSGVGFLARVSVEIVVMAVGVGAVGQGKGNSCGETVGMVRIRIPKGTV